MGGISQEEALKESGADSALAEVRRGWEQTGGRRWLVGPGCSIPPAVPAANLKAVAAAVGSLQSGDGRSADPAASPEVPR
jgi:uroporphyrinogen decarboxylase